MFLGRDLIRQLHGPRHGDLEVLEGQRLEAIRLPAVRMRLQVGLEDGLDRIMAVPDRVLQRRAPGIAVSLSLGTVLQQYLHLMIGEKDS